MCRSEPPREGLWSRQDTLRTHQDTGAPVTTGSQGCRSATSGGQGQAARRRPRRRSTRRPFGTRAEATTRHRGRPAAKAPLSCPGRQRRPCHRAGARTALGAWLLPPSSAAVPPSRALLHLHEPADYRLSLRHSVPRFALGRVPGKASRAPSRRSPQPVPRTRPDDADHPVLRVLPPPFGSPARDLFSWGYRQ